MTVKGNMPTLYKRLKKLPWAAVPAFSAVSTDHGRRTRRTIKVALVPAWIEFAGAAQVAQLRRTVTRNGKKTVEIVYQAPRTRSSTSGLTSAKARRKVDSSAGPRAAPSTASTSGPASAAHCPIAANDLDPAIPTASSPPARAGARASSSGPGPGQGDRAGTGCGQPG